MYINAHPFGLWHPEGKMRKATDLLLIAAAVICVVISGCKSESPATSTDSPIVKEVETAGSGKLEGLDQLTMQKWLTGHSDVAKKIAPECKAVGAKAPAAWATTTEGVLCTADAQVMLTMPTKLYKPF